MAKAKKEGKPKRNGRNLKRKIERINSNAALIKSIEAAMKQTA